jgi:hypothetical protein
MSTQSIDLSAVKNMNFNGTEIKTMNLNGSEIWKGISGIDGSNISYAFKVNTSDVRNGTYGTQFGRSVAVSATRIVCGTADDRILQNVGSINIFDINGNEIADITAPDGAANDFFGSSVAISDTAIVVGAGGDDEASGSVYIYDINGNYQTKITAPDGAANDHFGSSVAISDTAIVVGAAYDDDKGSSSGSAYIYDINGNYQNKITAPDGAADDIFGKGVAISDTAIVVGAYRSDDSGSVYIYDINGNYQTKITPPDGAANDIFGWSVAISDTAIVVGAWGDDDKGDASGSAYIYDINGNYQTKITAPDGAASDQFGWSVAISDAAIVVGAYGDDDDGAASGSAYIYDINGNYQTKITAPDGAANDSFGSSVAISDTAIVVGAYRDDDKGNDSGSAYIWKGA